MTEFGSQIATANLASLQALPSSYPELQLLSHCQAKIEQGFLWVRGRSMMAGYAQCQQQKNIWSAVEANDWYVTQDLVELHHEAAITWLRPLGRQGDFVKINGEGVNLALLREQLSSIVETGLVQEVTIADLHHERAGIELVLAHSAKVPASQAQQWLHQFNQQVRTLENLKRTVTIETLPRTVLGKIQWEELRRLSARI